MIIYDENKNIIENPDLTLGHLEPVQAVIHHDEVQAIEDQYHYEVIATYPNGGKDIARVVDVPGRPYRPAYDEIIDYMLYIEYTPEELENISHLDDDEDDGEDTPDPYEDRIAALEEQNEMLMECVLEMSELLYA